MGLNCSHDAFDGAYSAFTRLRKYVARCAGGSFPPHFDTDPNYDPECSREYWHYDDDEVPAERVAGLTLFLAHEDCDGELSVEECRQVAAALDWIAERGDYEKSRGAALTRVGPKMRDSVVKFANGCRAAVEAGEALTFG